MNTTSHSPQQSCRRCGTCCRKGGPALHLEDRKLVLEGKIPLRNLFTIRQGEPSYDNIAETRVPAASDIIKIKSAAADTTACIYYQHEEKSCRMYPHRPWECRTLVCWHPQPLMDQYHLNRLTRRDLLSAIEGLWELVYDHQNQCDYRVIAELATRLHRDRNDPEAADQLMTMIRYDQFIREGVVENSQGVAEKLEFLLGRPLVMTIRMFQLKLIRTESETSLQPFV